MSVFQVIALVALIVLWVCAFVLTYLQGKLDVLSWSLTWLEWEQNPTPWNKPGELTTSWGKVLLPIMLATIGTVLMIVTLFIGGK